LKKSSGKAAELRRKQWIFASNIHINTLLLYSSVHKAGYPEKYRYIHSMHWRKNVKKNEKPQH